MEPSNPTTNVSSQVRSDSRQVVPTRIHTNYKLKKSNYYKTLLNIIQNNTPACCFQEVLITEHGSYPN